MTNSVNHQPPDGPGAVLPGTALPGTALPGTALLTDQYELTMVQASLRSGAAGRRAVFEVFARHLPQGRRYGVVAGTGRLLEAIERFRFSPAELDFLADAGIVDSDTLAFCASYRFSGNIWGYAEGDCYFPGSPILVVEGTFAESVVLETVALSILNHDCAIASAASRMVTAAGRPPADRDGLAADPRAGRGGQRAGGVPRRASRPPRTCGRGRSTACRARGPARTRSRWSTTTNGRRSRPRSRRSARPRRCWWTPTDVPRAVRTAIEVAGPDLGAVRIDSGDLPVLARQVRAELDSLGAAKTRIVLTGDLDEYSIAALGAVPVDGYGVGTSLVTGSGAPTAALVYKLVARALDPGEDSELVPVAKRSVGKPGRGGRKWAVRHRDADGIALSERISLTPPEPGPRDRELLVPLVVAGEIVGREAATAARERHRTALAELPPHALQLSRGYPAIPTVFGPDGSEE